MAGVMACGMSFGILHALLDKIKQELPEYVLHTHYNTYTLKSFIEGITYLEVSEQCKCFRADETEPFGASCQTFC